MNDNELIQWYKRVFGEYPSVGLLAFIREVRRLDATALEQAAPGSAWERVPDGYYGDLSVEDDGKVIGFYFDDELGYAGADLPEGMVLMRPATAAGEEV